MTAKYINEKLEFIRTTMLAFDGTEPVYTIDEMEELIDNMEKAYDEAQQKKESGEFVNLDKAIEQIVSDVIAECAAKVDLRLFMDKMGKHAVPDELDEEEEVLDWQFVPGGFEEVGTTYCGSPVYIRKPDHWGCPVCGNVVCSEEKPTGHCRECGAQLGERTGNACEGCKYFLECDCLPHDCPEYGGVER